MTEKALPKAMQAPIRVMLVDDSAVVRSMLARALTETPGIEIVGTAMNGAMAIPLAAQHRPDVIVLDIEMPVMDGLTALPQLLSASPGTRVIMASTLTQRNADISLKALALGACDYTAKPSSLKGETEVSEFYRQLREKIYALGARRSPPPLSAPRPAVKPAASPAADQPLRIRALAIASSTGGPQALMTVLGGLQGKLTDIPFFITQHMPPVFTALLADHLTKAAGRPCHECKEEKTVQPGHIYLAAGDFHLVPEKKGAGIVTRASQSAPENFCRPSADPMLRSLSVLYGNELLLLVLTGMGSDGLEGAKAVVAAGGSVIAQDEATCVVWGMPRAVTEKGLCRAVLPLPEIASYLARVAGHAS